MSTKKEQIATALSVFAKTTSVYASYCNACEVYTVHCPDCNSNWCGGGCDCGCAWVLEERQSQLDEIIEELELKHGKS